MPASRVNIDHRIARRAVRILMDSVAGLTSNQAMNAVVKYMQVEAAIDAARAEVDEATHEAALEAAMGPHGQG